MSNSIKETLQAILDEASEKIEQSDALDKLNDVRVNFLGKKGQLTSVLKSMKVSVDIYFLTERRSHRLRAPLSSDIY